MSNTRKAAWSAAQIDAANAESLLGGLWSELEATAARLVVGRMMLRDLAARGAAPAAVAAVERALDELGEEFWTSVYHDITDGET